MILKQIVKNFLKFFGYKLIKVKKNILTNYLNIKDKASLVSLAESKWVLHLGAHKREEVDIYQWLGKKVIWVEVIPKVFNELKNNLYFYSNQDAYCLLLGDMDNIKKSFYVSNEHKNLYIWYNLSC